MLRATASAVQLIFGRRRRFLLCSSSPAWGIGTIHQPFELLTGMLPLFVRRRMPIDFDEPCKPAFRHLDDSVLAFLAFLPSSFVVCVESLPAAVDSISEIAEPETITTSPDVRCTLKRLRSKLSAKSFPRVSDSIRSIIPRRSPSCLKLTTHIQAMSSCIFDVICASRL